jgi:hypothetical protein
MQSASGIWKEWVLALGTRERNKLARERNMKVADLEDLRQAVRRRQWAAASRRYKAAKLSSTDHAPSANTREQDGIADP